MVMLPNHNRNPKDGNVNDSVTFTSPYSTCAGVVPRELTHFLRMCMWSGRFFLSFEPHVCSGGSVSKAPF